MAGCAAEYTAPPGPVQAQVQAQGQAVVQREPWDFDDIRDQPILDSVAQDISDVPVWRRFPPAPGTATPDYPASAPAAPPVFGATGFYPNVAQVCDTDDPVCEIPVLVRETAGGHCYAVLPFNRYIVRSGGSRPAQLRFVLAKWDSTNKTWAPRPASDRYRFNGGETVPLFGKQAGVYIHELHRVGSANQRRPMAQAYFTNQTLDSQGLQATWAVGTANTWARPPRRKENTIGRVYGGVMAAALVVNENVLPNDYRRFCKPVDPIIVNVAN